MNDGEVFTGIVSTTLVIKLSDSLYNISISLIWYCLVNAAVAVATSVPPYGKGICKPILLILFSNQDTIVEV